MKSSLVLLFLQLWGNVEVSLSNNECSKLPDVPHAHVSEETKKAEYEVGNVIHFPCEIGYISGPTIRYVCTSKGWDAAHQGRCYLKPCELPDDTPNGYYEIIHGEEFVFGTTIKYYCNEGYQMVSKEDTRTCLLDKWTNHLPICDPLSCEPPPADGDVTVQDLPENEGPILPDRFLRFSCEGPGKKLHGSPVLICGKDGKWDNPFPSCKDITCEFNVMHPHLNVTGLPPANETIKVGHKLRFKCDTEYTMNGPEEIECLQTGKWNAPFPTCDEKCKVTGVPSNVRIKTRVLGNQLQKGHKLRFDCRNRGETLRGNEVVECLAGGQWSEPFPTCGAPLDCERPPALVDGDTQGTSQYHYRHGDRVRYICQNFYTLEGEPHKTCNNGKWIGQMRCIKPCTVTDEAMSERNIAFKYTQDKKLYSAHNDVIEFRCVGRTKPVGTLNMRQKCVEGVMHLPRCQ